jgi:hypothetical protein
MSNDLSREAVRAKCPMIISLSPFSTETARPRNICHYYVSNHMVNTYLRNNELSHPKDHYYMVLFHYYIVCKTLRNNELGHNNCPFPSEASSW